MMALVCAPRQLLATTVTGLTRGLDFWMDLRDRLEGGRDPAHWRQQENH